MSATLEPFQEGSRECPGSRTGCTQSCPTPGDLGTGHRTLFPLAFVVRAVPQLFLPRALFETIQSMPGDAEASEGNGAMSLH